MHDVVNEISQWVSQGDQVILATVVHTWGSSPRGIGAKMAFTADGRITGSVSGGCVESQVFESGLEVLNTGHPQLLKFGVADETAFEVGLACGGNIEIYVRVLDPELFRSIETQMRELNEIAIATIVEGPDLGSGRELLVSNAGIAASDLSDELAAASAQFAREALSEGQSRTVKFTTREDQPVSLFIDVINPPPTLVMVGGVHIAIALTQIANALGYRTVIIDPRRAFGNQNRFPNVDQLIQTWPQEAFKQIKLTRSTCVALLTHDPKIDDPALKIVLESPVFYIGALGSQKTHASRRQRLIEAGVNPELLERIHGPIGLDLGAKTPEEIALSIMAEIVAVRRLQRTLPTAYAAARLRNNT